MSQRRKNPAFNSNMPAGARRLVRAISLGLGAAQSLSMAQIVTAAANAFGVDPSLALAVAQRESGLNPNLVNPTSGAAGLMQLMPATFAQMGVGSNIMDPVQNANAGTKYLGILLNRYGGDIAKTAAAYDWGLGNLDADIAQNGSDWLNYAPLETQNYVAALTGQTPGSTAPAQVQDQNIITIDASTGQVVPNVDVSTMPQATAAGILPAGFSVDLTDPATLAAIGLAGLAAYLIFTEL
jgi:soluble lytic murein transglycosylase-like protein